MLYLQYCKVFDYSRSISDRKHNSIISHEMYVHPIQTIIREKKTHEICSVNYENIHLNLNGNFECVCLLSLFLECFLNIKNILQELQH